MKKIKSLIARTIKNLGKITAFALLVIPSFAICCLLGSWTRNIQMPYGLVYTSDNVIDQDTLPGKILNKNKMNIELIGLNLYLTLTAESASDPYIFFKDVYTPEESGYYTISANIPNNIIDYFGFVTNNTFNNINSNYNTNTNVSYLNANTTYGLAIDLTNNLSQNYQIELYIMCAKGQTAKAYEPYGEFITLEQYQQTYNNYNELNQDYNELEQQYNELQNAYNNLLESKSIDYDNYTIKLINYTNSNTLSDNYTEIQTIQNNRNYINAQGFLDINTLRQIQGFGDTWDGILIESENNLNIYNYNLLFNGSGNPNLDFALYYTYYDNPTFTVLALNNIVGDSYYYGYFDLITLFGRNNISINNQNVLYNKFTIHWTNIPTDNDLVNIKLNSADGYNSGYAQGQADQLYNVEELTETIQNKERQIQELQTQYDTLLDHYNTAQIDNPLSQMVVSIADIPLNLFHEMFNFDIMGFNLSAFILGIITILLVAYVIKLFL